MRKLMLCVCLMGSSAWGQSPVQDAVRRFQESTPRDFTKQERDEIAAERAQLQRESMPLPRRGKFTMQARINAHRANRVTQKLQRRITPSPSVRIGIVIGGATNVVVR